MNIRTRHNRETIVPSETESILNLLKGLKVKSAIYCPMNSN